MKRGAKPGQTRAAGKRRMSAYAPQGAGRIILMKNPFFRVLHEAVDNVFSQQPATKAQAAFIAAVKRRSGRVFTNVAKRGL